MPIMTFVPETVTIVQEGFRVLKTMPDWYKVLLGAIV